MYVSFDVAWMVRCVVEALSGVSSLVFYICGESVIVFFYLYVQES